MADRNLEIIKTIQQTGRASTPNIPTTKITTEKSTMFKRKKKKTGVQTPEFRKPTPPPPPPTSGSNAVKPNYATPRVYILNRDELFEWIKTRANIGDVAYYCDYTSNRHYIYCYRKPDDNPAWQMMDIDFVTAYLQKENEGDDKMNITGICPYETPCGWCTKWDKKCDKKISWCGQRVKINPVDDAIDFSYGKCFDCKYEVGCDRECNPENNFKYFQSKEN